MERLVLYTTTQTYHDPGITEKKPLYQDRDGNYYLIVEKESGIEYARAMKKLDGTPMRSAGTKMVYVDVDLYPDPEIREIKLNQLKTITLPDEIQKSHTGILRIIDTLQYEHMLLKKEMKNIYPFVMDQIEASRKQTVYEHRKKLAKEKGSNE